MSSVHLSTASLPEIAQKGEVAVPAYDRAAVRAGIVHFGVGGFHRAHQARYLDELMNAGTALDFGIVGMGVMPSDARMRDALKAQDCLYTLVEKAPDGTVNPRVIGSIIDYVFAPDDPAAAVAVLADAAIRIVSLTVTEGGYNFDHVKGEFNLDQEHVAHDIAELKQGREDSLRTFFGLITAALMRRRAAGDTPFTVMSCDNIQGNGHVASAMFHAFAEAIDPQLAQWIRDEVPFPNSMVDRITPETTDADRADVADAYGYTDEWPVVCEDFTQWVLEDNFVAGRPEYEDAGVQVVQDVVPYELMKLRLLNASHQGLCYFGYLAGHRLVHDVVHDNLFADFLLAYMEQEATPSLRPVPGVDLDAYRRQLISRFGNEAVKDTVARLCAESSDRIPKWLLPVIRENIATGRPVELSAAIVASWARYDEGVDEQGEPITIVDALADRLHAAAQHNREDILAFVRDREIFGDLVDEPAFTQPYEATLRSLHEVGSIATLNTLLGRS
ncbi:mannitol dehydrogenase family protein [Corynebacterium uberis]|uniref:mannitol dehydrogenase family protein n=1 Tax=Corynebacterium TaxID=1716 RepID=UPI001D09A322|nr:MULTISPECIES: mannitol dehydrogenase family protein [Corynebacterium]MCZ9308331.1 mannitol dehydrogenase family protein [Corynebacterium sp. c6VSa_13]UDL74004.1 mannitol dehydrogenase family protein [Corynebacterium uberis]UDL75112.1 mannitol dehydrogenase family protein [Corynebacterium uberis]UDL77325.1 mannitol dehydrogenase family protein [Corynebacterium uberis]UDL79609.1 mannitol dehydrogenase family protein [Corynebacterium uberis]